MTARSEKILVLITALCLALLVLRPVDNYDVWWHLNSGLWMLNNGQIADRDMWSFTMYGKEWLNIAWLFQVMIAVVYGLFDVWGLFLFKAGILFTVILMLAFSLRPPRNILAFVMAFLVLLPIIYGHLHLRPHLIELLALAFVIWISQRAWNFRLAALAFLVLLVLANSHASIVACAAALALQVLFGKWSGETPLRTKAVVASLFILTPFFTPYGINIISLLLAHGGSDIIKYYIMEWFPHESYPLGVWLALLAVILFALNDRLRISFAEWFLLAFFFYFSTRYQRFELELGIVLLRPVSVMIDFALIGAGRYNPRLPLLLPVFLILAHGILYRNQILNLGPSLYADAPYNQFRYPGPTLMQLRALSDKLHRPVRIINDYDYGGYASLMTNGAVKIFIDGRMSTIFPESLLVPQYENDPAILKLLARRYQADGILLKLEISDILPSADPEWQRVGYDAASVLFIRRSLADRFDFPSITYEPKIYNGNFGPQQLEMFKSATLNLLGYSASNPVALNHMAVFLSGETSDPVATRAAIRYLEESSRLNPGDVFSRATYAYLLTDRAAGDDAVFAEFFRQLPAAGVLTPGISLSYDLAFARLLIARGLPDLALDYLYPAEPDRRRRLDKYIEAWKLRVLAHHASDQDNKARNCLDIAYGLIDRDDPSQTGDLDKLADLLQQKTAG